MNKLLQIAALLVLILNLTLSACATPPIASSTPSPTEISLAEASYSVSRSVADLAETAQAAHPLPPLAPPPSPVSYGMGGLTTIDWSGPVEPLIRQIAKSVNYRVAVMGTPPAIPIIVTINEKNVMLGDVLRNIGYQCGRRATVVVYPSGRVIELLYAKN
jgi:defect in organelle trafficking protein DotD